MNSWVPEHILSLKPYQPGKPIAETQREYKIRRVIKLASNENPLGPSPKAMSKIKGSLKELHRYPDGSGYDLKRALSRQLKVRVEEILLGNGSNEVIDMVVRTFCRAGESVVTSQSAFIAFKICAQINGVKVRESALTADYRFDLPAMLNLVKQNDDVRIVYLPNPNNPTGTYVSQNELNTFLTALQEVRQGQVKIILDDAYCDYVDAKDFPNALELQRRYQNVILTRTFSKIYGLPGLRLGYGIADAASVDLMNRVREPFNNNSLALVAGVAALSDQTFVRRAQKLNQVTKKFWGQQLQALGIPFLPSQGNFYLIDSMQGFSRPAAEVFQDCLKKGLILRPVANYGLPHHLRISFGTMAENRFAIQVFKQLLKKNYSLKRN